MAHYIVHWKSLKLGLHYAEITYEYIRMSAIDWNIHNRTTKDSAEKYPASTHLKMKEFKN
jgi:hypothetical protein